MTSRRSQAHAHSILVHPGEVPICSYFCLAQYYSLKYFPYMHRGSYQPDHPCEDCSCFIKTFVWWIMSRIFGPPRGGFLFLKSARRTFMLMLNEMGCALLYSVRMVISYLHRDGRLTTPVALLYLLTLEILSLEVYFFSLRSSPPSQ